MPLKKGVQNNVSEFNSFDYKISIFKNAMYAHVGGIYLYAARFLYDFALLILGPLSCSLDTRA